MNKCDVGKKKKEFKKRDVKKIISKKLRPIVDRTFPDSDTEIIDEEVDLSNDEETDNESKDRKSVTFDLSGSSPNDGAPSSQNSDIDRRLIRKKRNFTNATLLQPPNLSLVYDEGDNQESDSETDKEEDEMFSSDDGMEKKRRRIKTKKTSSDLLTIHHIYQKQKQRTSHKGDPFNTPRAKDEKKKRKKSSKKKVKKRNKADIKYIDIISCSAKNGRNVEKLFGTCIKKTIPSKLTKSVVHKRTKTTAHVTAPIWLRQVVAEFQKDPSNEKHPFFDETGNHSDVDDNFHFLGEDDQDHIHD